LSEERGVKRMRQATVARLIRWTARRHGTDSLPTTISRRRIYIVPTRFGIALALLLIAMLVAGLNYNSNLGLAFGFLLTSLALVAMHHCHRNLLGLRVNVTGEVDAFAGGYARFDFVLRNDAAIERCDIEIRCAREAGATRSRDGGAVARKDAPEGRAPGWRESTRSRDGAADARRAPEGRAPGWRESTRSRDGAADARRAPEGRAPGWRESTHNVPAKSYQRAAVEMPVAHRGITRQNQFELRTRYPFGWFRAWTYVHSPLTVFVAPDPRGNRELPSAAAAIGTASQSELRGDEDFAGLRAYEAGVPLKHMAWKVLARGGEPAVRSYTDPAAQPEWLDWSALEGLEVEARLSQLCRWILDSETAQNPYGLRIPGTEITPARGAQHRSACLRALARYGEPADAPAQARA
jgi:uncharacterized protein (DUF58 family)